MKNNKTILTQKVTEVIFDESLDVFSELTEVGIDTLITNDLLSNIPIIKTITSFYKIGHSIIEQHNLKKLFAFLQQLSNSQIEKKTIQDFKSKINSEKELYEIVELTLVYNEKMDEIIQSKIMANLFNSLLRQDISWIDYRSLLFILKNLNPSTYKYLIPRIQMELYKVKKEEITNYPTIKIDESIAMDSMWIAAGIRMSFGENVRFTITAKKLYDFGLKQLEEEIEQF